MCVPGLFACAPRRRFLEVVVLSLLQYGSLKAADMSRRRRFELTCCRRSSSLEEGLRISCAGAGSEPFDDIPLDGSACVEQCMYACVYMSERE
jgi:hypothetical protein